jgi:hypothetical protein
MPITAKFSKTFYDTLGHEIADEMVNWFNQADTVYRTQLRELNDLNYARVEAKFEQLEAKIDQRFAEQDAKWERRFAEQSAKWEQRFGDLSARVDKLTAIVEAQPLAIQANLLKWMVVLWATTILAIVGIR